MLNFYFEYFYLSLFLCISIILGLIMFVLPFFLAPHFRNDEHLSSYECGFESFDDARIKFDIQFYIIAILFIVFDVEIICLLPWILFYYQIGFYGYIIVFIFLVLLIAGFVYEWLKRGLDWYTQTELNSFSLYSESNSNPNLVVKKNNNNL